MHDQIVTDLPALLRGELGRARLAEVVEHLETCDECRLELVAAAQGHSAVTAAVRTLRPESGPATAPGAHDTAAPELPPLAPTTAVSDGRGGSRAWSRPLAAVALGVAVLVGLNRETAPTVPVQTARLSAVTGAGSGEVTHALARPEHVHDRPDQGSRRGRPGHFYYAWLLDPATNKMLPLGQVGADGTATFEVDSGIVASYHAVDVSLQSDNGNPGHSDTSVLRAQY